ncbi:DNA-binding transcriptional regulator, XRE-family HTH domain [Halobacillus alkaliphilus]|uniref:DNA-binding transcriptional regulator, XRE-family HTH domain n=1 Tax=Halobacillus alkaliphilus TaxID=396056 RepID=A0A1I2K7G2_9BACI|nr:helix-turn-helix domain-containing protein [Halobacillus alkaliphilus]SFF62383.1 DNA-binding transcriptional regulator, XRE-family HTH domain [Halobacillus alkaliphilus]
MNKEQLRKVVSEKIKLIRVEYGYTQTKMAEVLGLSKKTLVQIEKGRTIAGWTTVVAVCALFQDSEVLKGVLGDAPIEIAETIAHHQVVRPIGKTMGGKVWWTTLKEKEDFLLQQNMISKHYRIIDNQFDRWFSTFEEEEAYRRFGELGK